MKKRLTIVCILLSFLTPIMVNAKEFGVTCDKSEMLKMQDEIKNVSINIELLPEGTKITNPAFEESLNASNLFKISAKSLPSGYYINIYNNTDKTEKYYVDNDNYSIINKGGVYIVDFRNSKCGFGIIKSYEIMIPYFDKDNTNVWYDGTYLDKENNNKIQKEYLNVRLLIILIVLVLVIIISIIFAVKKNKKNINLNLFILIIISLTTFIFMNNVYAAEYVVDSGGSPLNPSIGGYSGNTGSGIWLMTGVGFKVSLVNVENMTSVSDFIVLKDNGSMVDGGLNLKPWYKYAKNEATNYGIIGRISATYSTDKTVYNVCSTDYSDVSKRCILIDDGWFLISAGYNTPNVTQSEITNRLFVKQGNEYVASELFYEYLARLLYSKPIQNVSKVNSSNDAKNLLQLKTYAADRVFLKNYRIIVEPLYISGYADGSSNAHRVYTLKAAFNTADVNIAYENDYLENFYAIQKSHGQIMNTNLEIKDSKSGLGYIIFGIVDDEEETCNPNSKDNCCYDAAGEYHAEYTGAALLSKFKCVGRVDKNNVCLSKKVEPCVSSNCKDTQKEAICDYDSDVTTAVFHEDDDLANCTIGKGNSSGFTIVDPDETMGYCEVACKDDIDIILPSAEKALSGSYFKFNYMIDGLNQYTPEIKTTRTCVTSKIDYKKFDSDLTKLEELLKSLYNEWQDWIQINGDIDEVKFNSGGSKIDAWTKKKGLKCDGDVLGRYDLIEWQISSSRGTNGTYYKGYSDSYQQSDECPTQDLSKDTYYEQIYKRLKEAEKAYNNALKTYVKTIAAYNKCFGWTENTQSISYINNKSDSFNDCYSPDLQSYQKCVNSRKQNLSAKNKNADRYSISVTVSSAHEVVRKSYDYKFKPDVSFNYQETGKNYYPTEYKFLYDKDVTYIDNDGEEHKYDSANMEGILPITDKTYWSKNMTNEIDDYYKTGQKVENVTKENRFILNCTGTTCNTSDEVRSTTGASIVEEIFFYTNKYILRSETYDYVYHLPVLSTVIPSGIVNVQKHYNDYNDVSDIKLGNNQVLLVENNKFINALPVNISTVKGKYPYSITIDNLFLKTGFNADLRYKMRNDNADDNFENRFEESEILIGKGSKENKKTNGNVYVCEYEVINDIYDPEKNNNLFFYRPVEIAEINPLGRTLGYNWSDTIAKKVKQNMKTTGNDYMKLTDGKNDKFEFTLTPTLMQSIRKYNKFKSYGDFNLTCTKTDGDSKNKTITDNYHCYSSFLSCLASLSANSSSSSSNLCYNILEGRNLTLKTNYGYEELKKNREILINKQDALFKLNSGS